MPLYEFDCGKCGEPFEKLVRSTEAVKDVTCPNCGSRKVKKKLSRFASKVSGSSSASASAAACAPGGT